MGKSLTRKKTSSSLVLPGCDLAKAKTMEDLNDCVRGFLTEAKKAGSYESNLAQSLTENTVLSPEDAQTKIDADAKASKEYSDRRIKKMNEDTAALSKMLKQKMAENQKKMDAQSKKDAQRAAALHKKVQDMNKKTRGCVENGMGCNKKCLEAAKDDFMVGEVSLAECSTKCTTDHTSCLNKVNLAHM